MEATSQALITDSTLLDDMRRQASADHVPLNSDPAKQMEFVLMLRQLQNDLAAKTSECGLLRIKLSQSDDKFLALNRELNDCKLTMFQSNEDVKKSHEEVAKSKKLEEDYVQLMSSYLDLEARYEAQRQNLYDSYLAKTNAINNYESLMSHEAQKYELDELKKHLTQKQADSILISAKLRNSEEENNLKDKCISDLKKSLDDAKITHKHEITILEEYIQCLKNTIISYEKTLANYEMNHGEKDIQVDNSDELIKKATSFES